MAKKLSAFVLYSLHGPENLSSFVKYSNHGPVSFVKYSNHGPKNIIRVGNIIHRVERKRSLWIGLRECIFC